MRRFAFIEPPDLAAATEALARGAGKAAILAGGLDLLGEMKDRIIEPAAVVNLKTVRGLDAIRFEPDGSLRIGALATLASVAAHPRLGREYPAVAQAAQSVGSVEIRNVGTVGGNLCQRPRCWYYRSPLHKCLKKGGDVCFTTVGQSRYHAILGGGPSYIVHPSDLAPALIACDARITVVGPDGTKDLPLEQFYVLPSVRLDHETILKPGEIVTEVSLPASASADGGTRSRFLKFREKDSFDFALVSVAVALRLQGNSCSAARVVLGGVAPTPWRSKEAESAIVDRSIGPRSAAKAAAAALADASPMSHNEYKIPLARTLITRALLETADQGTGLAPS